MSETESAPRHSSLCSLHVRVSQGLKALLDTVVCLCSLRIRVCQRLKALLDTVVCAAFTYG
ncbi:hypothetical protein DPMN_039559 [Dreissena polymorpha]|uniref:Uncharacterized protein n=1 Tax=Dreissena polymorpha TaxID=45954 RepID=A0A9D4HUH4_DREPO|nr:hypothetical protein DPMN_039558 [Dreissena polymorpha]KAH3733134.1 hypothetical protein DPMN_039559 [Dreissena polymorpha]